MLLDLMFPGEEATLLDLARAALAAGDAVMSRLWSYVKEDGGRIDEQIDKHTGGGWRLFLSFIYNLGAQTSAAALTWSYANILHSLHTRKNVKTMMEMISP